MVALVICQYGALRDSLVALLSSMPEFEIVSTANDLDAASGYIGTNCPALALLVVDDLGEEYLNSLRQFKAVCSRLSILAFVQTYLSSPASTTDMVDAVLIQGVDARKLRQTISILVRENIAKQAS